MRHKKRIIFVWMITFSFFADTTMASRWFYRSRCCPPVYCQPVCCPPAPSCHSTPVPTNPITPPTPTKENTTEGGDSNAGSKGSPTEVKKPTLPKDEELPIKPPIEKPAEKPPVEKPAEKPVVEKPADKGDDLDDLFNEPVEKPAEKPAVEKPADKGDDLDDLFNEPAVEDKTQTVKKPVIEEPAIEEPAVKEPADKDDDLDDLFNEAKEAAKPNPNAKTAKEVLEGLKNPQAKQEQPAKAPSKVEEKKPAVEEPKEGGDNLEDLFGAATAPAKPIFDMRTWEDNTGTFSVKGKLVEVGDDYVRLLKENGHYTRVPTRRLSEKDTTYVQENGSKLLNGSIIDTAQK